MKKFFLFSLLVLFVLFCVCAQSADVKSEIKKVIYVDSEPEAQPEVQSENPDLQEVIIYEESPQESQPKPEPEPEKLVEYVPEPEPAPVIEPEPEIIEAPEPVRPEVPEKQEKSGSTGSVKFAPAGIAPANFMPNNLLTSGFVPVKAEPVTYNLLDTVIPVVYGEQSFETRIAKRCQGRKPVGLVLTGGSARGLAHIGVLKCLEENGVVPDYIISNSMGSIVSLLYAAGLSPDQILEIFKSTDIEGLFKTQLPIKNGLLNCDGFVNTISQYIPEKTRIESLKIPVMIVGEDFVSRRQILIAEGDFLQVFSASFAMPFFFSPVKYKEHILTDGGTANLAPVDIAYKYGSDVIISTTFNSPEGSDFTNPVTALMESFDLGKNRESVREILNHKDALWIRCDVENFNMTQYDAVEELVSRGYESAKTVSGNMSVYSNGGVDSSLSEVRSEYAEVIPQILERTSRFNHSPARKMSSYAAIVGRSFDTRLRDDMTLGLGYAFAKGDFSFDVTAGMAARAANDDRYTVVRQAANRDARVPSYESKPYISAPQVAFHTDYFFAENRFHVAADVAYRLNRGFWLNQQFEYRWKNLTALENFETDFKTTHMRIGAEYLLLKMLRFEGGFRTDSFKQFWGYVGAEGNFSFRPVKLYAKVRTDIGIKTCTVLSAEIDAWYVFDKASVVSDVRLGLYGKIDHNFGYRKDEADGYGKSTAFEMGFDGRLVLSMSGLRQYPFRLRVGYNFADKKVVWSSKINF